MKKIILSIVASAVISGSLMASDTTSLTKAVVQLIKDNHAINSNVNALSDREESSTESMKLSITNLEAATKANADAIAAHDKLIATNGANIIGNKSQIETLTARAASSDATINTAYEKATGSSTTATALDTTMIEQSKTVKLLADKVACLEDEAKQLAADHQQQEELVAKLESTKVYLEAEIKILKAKFDRARPVYVVDQKSLDCTDGKCKDTGSDDIIKDFVK